MKNFSRSRFSSLTLVVTVNLLSVNLLFAQGEAPVQKTLLDRWVIDGGPTMLFIGAAIVGFIALLVYNYMNLTKTKFLPADLYHVLLDHMTQCRVRSAIEVAASSPSFLGRMVAYSFPNVDATEIETLGRDKVEDAMADFINHEVRKGMQWISYISVIGQASPMLGLLGTVMGMVGAFSTLQTAGAADPSQLAGDISVALLTTLWGLINAIPCIIFFYVLRNRYNALVADATRAAEALLGAAIATVHAETIYAKIPEGLEV